MIWLAQSRTDAVYQFGSRSGFAQWHSLVVTAAVFRGSASRAAGNVVPLSVDAARAETRIVCRCHHAGCGWRGATRRKALLIRPSTLIDLPQLRTARRSDRTRSTTRGPSADGSTAIYANSCTKRRTTQLDQGRKKSGHAGWKCHQRALYSVLEDWAVIRALGSRYRTLDCDGPRFPDGDRSRGEFLTNPAYLEDLAKKAPRWRSRISGSHCTTVIMASLETAHPAPSLVVESNTPLRTSSPDVPWYTSGGVDFPRTGRKVQTSGSRVPTRSEYATLLIQDKCRISRGIESLFGP